MEIREKFENLTVDEYTSVDPITIAPDINVLTARNLMKSNNIRHIPVVEDGIGIGLISDRDIRRLDEEQLPKTSVKDVMIDEPFTVRSNAPLKEVVFEMSQKKIGSALVNDENERLYGIFTSTDALNSIIEQ